MLSWSHANTRNIINNSVYAPLILSPSPLLVPVTNCTKQFRIYRPLLIVRVSSSSHSIYTSIQFLIPPGPPFRWPPCSVVVASLQLTLSHRGNPQRAIGVERDWRGVAPAPVAAAQPVSQPALKAHTWTPSNSNPNCYCSLQAKHHNILCTSPAASHNKSSHFLLLS